MNAQPINLFPALPLTPIQLGMVALQGWSGYLMGLCRRRADILDVATDFAEIWRVTTLRERPRWAHPNTIRRRWPLANLRDYSVPGDDTLVPTLVLPPQAGHDSCVIDYAHGQSQMLTLRDAGLTKLYCLDWRTATPDTADATIEDYVDVLYDAVVFLGGRVNLVGDSQGGWLSAVYAALHPTTVHSLTIAGSPIDFHAGRPTIGDLGALTRDAETNFHRAIVAAAAGLQRGIGQVIGFKAFKPAAEFQRAMGLLANIDDPGYVQHYLEIKGWFEWSQEIPREFYEWILEHLFVSNRLVSGELEVAGGTVDLAAISCPLYLIAGGSDFIAPPEQVWALERYTSTPPDQVTRELVDAGHLSLFIGRKPLEQHWLPVMREVARLSTPSSASLDTGAAAVAG